MCGIAGSFSSRPSRALEAIVQAITRSQVPRGPDHQAVLEVRRPRSCAVLGHTRLSIIDLSPAGNQPMWDRRRRLCIVFNGEIYNYVELRSELLAAGHEFHTGSDTEVILEAFREWNTSAFPRLNGMFAFALFDADAERLYLVRDRFGVKPLVYHCTNQQELIFASTASVIAERCGLGIDAYYLAQGAQFDVYEDRTGKTQYKDVSSVPVGSYLEFSTRDDRLAVDTRCYYSLEDRVLSTAEEIAGIADAQVLERLDDVLRSAVRLRLRADVPIGVSLSGGLDSSTVAALLIGEGAVAHGVSFSAPNTPASEGSAVADVARFLGIEVSYIWPTTEDMARALWQTIVAQDAPFPNLSVVAQYAVFQTARAKGLKVMLGGQGGDEVFMGYRKYQFFELQSLLRARNPLNVVLHLLPLILTAAAEARTIDRYWQQRHRYWGNQVKSRIGLPAASLSLGFRPDLPLWRRQLADVRSLSLPTLLRYEDRNSMGNSVESRLPFLDYRVVELGLAIRDGLKLRSGYGKYAIRQIMQHKLPAAVSAARTKSGFDVAHAMWIRQGLGTVIREHLRRREQDWPEWLGVPNDPATLFPDRDLAVKPSVFAQAITLLWIGTKECGRAEEVPDPGCTVGATP
jgi:asparagine synthase (glutamine-hydrolysing)